MQVVKKALFLIFLGVLSLTLFHYEAGAETEKERVKKLIEGAKKEGTVMFYGSTPTKDGRVLIKPFEKKYPFLKVKHYRAGSDTLLQKILTETRASKYFADVYNIRSSEASILVEKGLFAQYSSPQVKFYPKGFREPKGHWVSFYMNPATIGYNSRLVPPDQAPKDWSDLLDPKWKGQMVIDREETNWFANMLKFMGREKGLDFMKKLAGQDLTFSAGHTLMAQLVAAGEYKVGVVLYTPRMESMKATGAPIEWVRANPVIAYHYALGVAAKGPHPNAARLFVDFLLSKRGQELMVKTTRVPVRVDVKPKPSHLVEGVNLLPTDSALDKDFKKYFSEYRMVFKAP